MSSAAAARSQADVGMAVGEYRAVHGRPHRMQLAEHDEEVTVSEILRAGRADLQVWAVNPGARPGRPGRREQLGYLAGQFRAGQCHLARPRWQVIQSEQPLPAPGQLGGHSTRDRLRLGEQWQGGGPEPVERDPRHPGPAKLCVQRAEGIGIGVGQCHRQPPGRWQ